MREPVTADDIRLAVGQTTDFLSPAAHGDWSVPAGTLRWSCLRTAEHVADCLMAYAGQVALPARQGYVPFITRLNRGAGPEGALEFIRAAGSMVASVVREADPSILAYHPYGMADPEGFAAMSCIETMVHGQDVAGGFGLELAPDRSLCSRVLNRLFPDLADAPEQPWQLLLWSTGRIDLPGRLRVKARWRWTNEPQ